MHEPTWVAPTMRVRSRRRGRATVIVAATVLAACCAGGSTLALVRGALTDASHRSGSRAAGAAGVGEAAPGLNVPVRDGKFEFLVSAVSCGHASVGEDWFRAQAKGQFCVVTVRVTNIGTEAQRFADGYQKAFGPEGNLYAADTGAGVVANQSGDAVWNVVNPGINLQAKIVYDIPTTATIARIELHDSPFSGGVVITVGAPTT